MELIRNARTCHLLPNVATIGFFDGVHLGHRHLIAQVIKIAEQRKLQSLIITFMQHPRKVLDTDYQPGLLNTFEEKATLLAQCGPDYCCPLDFNKEMSRLTSRNFMYTYLKNMLNVQVLVVGYDHHFGSDRQASFQDYVRYGQQLGIEVVQGEEFLREESRISSSAIRFCIQTGEVEKAAQLLGYPYTLEGRVTKGRHLGRKIGFPTANIDIASLHKMLPLDGAYAVRTETPNEIYKGMAYIGRRPTVDTDGRRSLEVHLLGFTGDLYGQPLRLEFVKRLRGEKRFHSLDELSQALHHDLEETDQLIDL